MGHRNFGGMGQRNNGVPQGGIDLSQMANQQQQQQQHANNVVLGFAEKIYLDMVCKLPVLEENEMVDKSLMRRIARTSLEYAPYFAEAIGMIKIEDPPKEEESKADLPVE